MSKKIPLRIERIVTAMVRDLTAAELRDLLLHGSEGLLYLEPDEIDEHYAYYVESYDSYVNAPEELTGLHEDLPTREVDEDLYATELVDFGEFWVNKRYINPELPWEAPPSTPRLLPPHSEGYQVVDRRSAPEMPRCPANSR